MAQDQREQNLAGATTRAAHPERCVQAYYLQRTRFERIVKRKLRQPS